MDTGIPHQQQLHPLQLPLAEIGYNKKHRDRRQTSYMAHAIHSMSLAHAISSVYARTHPEPDRAPGAQLLLAWLPVRSPGGRCTATPSGTTLHHNSSGCTPCSCLHLWHPGMFANNKNRLLAAAMWDVCTHTRPAPAHSSRGTADASMVRCEIPWRHVHWRRQLEEHHTSSSPATCSLACLATPSGRHTQCTFDPLPVRAPPPHQSPSPTQTSKQHDCHSPRRGR
jgi:hypothetical protein